MDSAQWTQEFGVAKSMAAEIGGPNACSKAAVTERKARPQKDEAVNCPRCHSTNTKFCYYNNYSLTQPRYFCKTCRRYWTEGGTLRNVPVGGGSRKNKRSSSSSIITPSPLSSHSKLPDLSPPSISPFSSQNPKIHYQGHDLNLRFHGDYGHVVPQFLEFPKMEGRDAASNSANTSSSAAPVSALNFFRNGIAGRGLNSMGTSDLDQNNAIFASNFASGLSFPIEESRYESSNNASQENVKNGSLMFRLGGASRRSPNANEDEEKGQENCNGFWNGMLG